MSDLFTRATWPRLSLLALALGLVGCRHAPAPPLAPPPPAAAPPAKAGVPWQLTSRAFGNGEQIPVQCTGDGQDLSPPLAWTTPPAGTAELVLICVDPGAQDGPFTHWLVYGLSPLATSLPQDLPAVPRDTLDVVQYDQGVNDAGKIGYYGPAPPPGRPHRYQFTLYALSAPTGLPAGAQKGQVLRALEGKVLGKATLEGLYGR